MGWDVMSRNTHEGWDAYDSWDSYYVAMRRRQLIRQAVLLVLVTCMIAGGFAYMVARGPAERVPAEVRR